MDYTPLNYEGFEQYLIKEGSHIGYGGLAYEFKFDNNYGASVIKHDCSYGNVDDLFELAVLYDGQITYDTDFTQDVIGWLTQDEVIEFLEHIKNL
jgi:hypothetical protein